MLSALSCDDRGENVEEAIVAAALVMRNNQHDNRRVQDPANDIHRKKAQRLRCRRVYSRFSKRPSSVPKKTIQHRQKKRNCQGWNQADGGFMIEQIKKTEVDYGAANTNDAEFYKLSSSMLLVERSSIGH
jgi:hypothetical protein